MIMCAQNEFDPIILEKELIDRREMAKKKQMRIAAIEGDYMKNASNKQRRKSLKEGDH
eukprot:CAMPEP_0185596408 /NCGR_PEP_ID=MMETSP0434-20130131/80742_1 /TAXON_ID=626734 ORGANISM="Favella taraikaensis, Strain Fe Narragansett Bay" /NCGR_SAMPLE_ID=MMETSP0434 /ASSEMBLY_ACC=CAM_ASM_000379 /LENGTH=57 /DNA_ID=CAMNT_0028224909 /DNA_START=1272 /DNA_END=1445 /DNA_ORIENTATION=-